MDGYLARKGLQLIRNGYRIIPIPLGGKFPTIKNWQKIVATPEMHRKWITNGRAEDGVGILTGEIVGLDLDTPDGDMALWSQDLAFKLLGFAPVQIGQAPKRMLIYRTETPFRKISSRAFEDLKKRKNQIEFLGDGQQFVSDHIHPVTGKPYRWVQSWDLTQLLPGDLVPVTLDDIQEFMRRWEAECDRLGWTPLGSQTTTAPTVVGEPDDDDLDLDAEKRKPLADIDEDELEKLVMSIPNHDGIPYEVGRSQSALGWFEMLAAIHHQTGSSERGRQIAYQWSTRAPKHTDERFDKTWNSFHDDVDQRRRPMTARYIKKWAKIERKKATGKRFDEILLNIDLAANFDGLKEAAASVSQLKDLEPIDRERLVSDIQQAACRLGTRLPVRTVRDMVRYRQPETDVAGWLQGWVFLTHTGQFYHQSTGRYVDSGAFDKAFGRHVGEDTTPTWVATRVTPVPVYHMTTYLPGEEPTFCDVSGVEWINTYRDTSPPIPKEYSKQDLRNVERIKNHAVHLFGEEQRRDIEILHSTLAYIVQTGKRVNWLTLIQGAEKIGKTFYADLLGAVLGGEPHVYMLDSDTLTNSSFTEWAQGHQVVCIEELKVHARGYDVMNKLKPYITNTNISVHPKGVKQYNAINTAAYFAFTNYRDAVPVTEGDTRYFIMLSRWQNSKAVDAFRSENPKYYGQLFDALEQSPGALRRWLLEYELHPDFNPVARAPQSEGKAQIIDEAKPDLQIHIEDILSSGETTGVSDDLVVVHLLRGALSKEMNDGRVEGFLSPKTIAPTLRRLQFTPIRGGFVKITDTEKNIRQNFFCWSRNPEIQKLAGPDIRKIIIRDILPRLSTDEDSGYDL